MVLTGNIASAGPYILLFFTTLALGFSGYRSLNGLVFTTMIFAGVSAALYYPGLFTYVGEFKLTILIIPLIQVIMFGMGTQMGLKDFAAVFKTPRGL
jgi:BASS family bile acid:Na+ symporter